jgi:hypothetical protein
MCDVIFHGKKHEYGARAKLQGNVTVALTPFSKFWNCMWQENNHEQATFAKLISA